MKGQETMTTTQTTWTVRGKVSGRRYTATAVGAGSVRLTHSSGVTCVIDASVVARDCETVTLLRIAREK